MSSPTWTPAALASESVHYEGRGWRFVEAQHRVSTLKLVDTLEEQRALESLIETTKPVIPEDCRHLDYLLATPFRYAATPRTGSRFQASGICQWRLLRVRGVRDRRRRDRLLPSALLRRVARDAVAEGGRRIHGVQRRTGCRSCGRSDGSPFVEYRATWIHPTSYEPCQGLADAARSARRALIRYESVRDPRAGVNLAVLGCSAFSEPRPIERHTWRIRIGATGAQALCEFPRRDVEFPPGTFTDPRLAALEWRR